MPSKTSKARSFRRSLWKSEPACDERGLARLARELSSELRVGDRVLLEGELGAGKTTFARALIEALGVVQPPEGSPSFAIAHEYDSPRGNVVHVDLYRLKDPAEIVEAGIEAYFWEREAIVISEWTSMFLEFEQAIFKDAHHRAWIVTLEFPKDETVSQVRSVKIERQ